MSFNLKQKIGKVSVKWPKSPFFLLKASLIKTHFISMIKITV